MANGVSYHQDRCELCRHEATIARIKVTVEEEDRPIVQRSETACTNPDCDNYRAPPPIG